MNFLRQHWKKLSIFVALSFLIWLWFLPNNTLDISRQPPWVTIEYIECSSSFVDPFTEDEEEVKSDRKAILNFFGVDTTGARAEARSGCQRDLEATKEELEAEAKEAEAERQRRAEEARLRAEAERRQREAAEQRERQVSVANNPCEHVYTGKVFTYDYQDPFLDRLFNTSSRARAEVRGYSNSNGMATARDVTRGNTFEISCGSIP